VFSLSACSVGIAVTFLPLAALDPSGTTVPAALLAHGVLAAASRWWTGRRGDEAGSTRQLVPGTLLSIGGLALLALSSPAALVMGMALLGVGFGIAQSASLQRMFAPGSGGRLDHDLVSTVWNLAYDAGMGLGAAAFGWLAVRAGYPAGFAIAAGLLSVLTLASATARGRYL
jgi:predicted MFS family arabinose efflux permease